MPSAMHVVTELDPDTGRPPGPERLPRRFRRTAWRSPTSTGGPGRSPPTASSSWAGTARSPPRPPWAASSSPAASAPASIPAPPSRPGSTSIPAKTTEIVFLLGEAEDLDEARRLVRRYWEPDAASRGLAGRRRRDGIDILEAVQVRTPDPAFDLLLNRWLLYQVMSLPPLGPIGVLPVGRGLRLPRPAPGRDGACPRRPRGGPGPYPPCGVPAVPRRRRAALVAPARRTRGPHADLRRPALASLRRPPITSRRRETHRSSTSSVPYLKGPLLEPGQEDDYGLPAVSERVGLALRALPPRPRARAAARASRPAADGQRRLERRDEPGRRRRPGRERLARLVPDRLPAPVRRDRRGQGRRRRARPATASRPTALRAAIEEHAWDGDWYLRAFFDDGTPLGSARNRRVPDRLDRPVLGGDLGRRRSASAADRAMEAVQERLVRARMG